MSQEISGWMQAEEQLREREAQYRSIFEATNDAMIITDSDGFCVEANPAACHMYGYTYEEMVGLHAMAATHPDYHALAGSFLNALHVGDSFMAESVALRKDGTPFHIETRASQFIYRGKPHILAVVRDVTERVRARELLEQHVEERTRELSTLLEVSTQVASTLELRPLLGLILDQLTMIVDNSGAAIHVVEGEWLEMLEHRFPPGNTPGPVRKPLSDSRFWQSSLRHGVPVVIDDLLGDSPDATWYRALLGDELESTLPYVRSYIAVPLVHKGRAIGALVTGHPEPGYFTPGRQDLLMALTSQAAVAIENARLYERARDAAALEERQRLSRELHDSISQALYSIALGVRTGRALVEREPAQAVEPLDFALAQSERALAETRALILALRPEALEQEGLVGGLQRQAEALRARQHITVETALCVEPAVPLAVKEALFRITQEALHNIVKHARAGVVSISLAWVGQDLILRIQDNGQGFDPAASYPGHLGLHSMRERAVGAGGTLHVESVPGGGTCVCVAITCTQGERSADDAP